MTTDAASDWALFYRLEGDVPREFCEVRRVDTVVWVRTGAVETWGSRETAEYAGIEEAVAQFHAACARKSAEGWTLTRHGVYDPATFDFEALRREIRDGARQAFAAIRAAHPDQSVNAYALVTDESAMTIGPVANSEEAVAEADEDADDVRFSPDEWSFFEGGEYLDLAYRLILPRQQDVPSEIAFTVFQAGVFEAGIAALEELDREGFFGTGAARDEVLVLFHVTDADPLLEAVRRLNTPAMEARYREWYGAWS